VAALAVWVALSPLAFFVQLRGRKLDDCGSGKNHPRFSDPRHPLFALPLEPLALRDLEPLTASVFQHQDDSVWRVDVPHPAFDSLDCCRQMFGSVGNGTVHGRRINPLEQVAHQRTQVPQNKGRS
jgi:hypothetical protein